MFDYHVVTFNHERAAESLMKDLATLKVPNVGDGPFGSKFAVAVRIPDGTSTAAHLEAVKAISLGRGAHTVQFARY